MQKKKTPWTNIRCSVKFRNWIQKKRLVESESLEKVLKRLLKKARKA